MKKYFLFIFWWIFFISPAEYLINTMIIPWASLGKFFWAVGVYIFLLTLYYIFRWRSTLMRQESKREKIIEIFILGSFWLFVMEWMIIGNSPLWNPSAIQSSMFIWWVWVFLFPKVMISKYTKLLQKKILVYHILYSSIFFFIGMTAREPIIFVFVYGYGLWAFYYFTYLYIQISPLEVNKKDLSVIQSL